MKGTFGMSVCLLLGVLWVDSQPIRSDTDTVRELIELLRSIAPLDQQAGQDTELMGSEQLWYKAGAMEKRDLPRLGVSVYRASPSRVHSSKTVDASRYRFSSPSQWMANLQG